MAACQIALQQAQCAQDNAIELARLALGRAACQKAAYALHDVAGLGHLLTHAPHGVQHHGIGKATALQGAQHTGVVTRHGGQGLVELVGQGRGHLAQCGQARMVAQGFELAAFAFFRAFALGDVHNRAHPANIFDNYAELHKVTQGPVGRMLLDKLDAKGVKGLSYWDNGFKSFSANKPLKTPADFKGMKMRIQSSKVLESQMRALGSLPQVLAFSEVYQALQTGVVDGTENPISNLYTQKMHEVQKHLTLSEHGYLGYAVITNKKFWDALPADIRKQLDDAMAMSTLYANQIAKMENDKALEAVKASGKTQVYTPTAAERLELKKALLKTHTDMESRIGKDLIQNIYKETGFNPAKL